MVKIIAPLKATVELPGADGKKATKTIMLENTVPVADVQTIEEAVQVTAGIVDTFAKGYHYGGIVTGDDGTITIKAVKE